MPLVVVAALALSGVQTTPVEIRVRPTPRLVLSYEMRVSMDAGDENTVDARIFMEDRFVKQVGKTLYWTTDVKNVLIETTGQFKAAEASLKESFDFDGIFERDDRHRTLAISIGDFRVKSGPNEGTSDVVLPDRPVRPGDRWPGRFSVGGKTVPVNYVYRGPHRVNGTPTYLIEALFAEKDVEQVKPYRFHVAQDDGRTVLASGAARVALNGITIGAEFSLRRTAKYTAPE